ncbi:hypothetical protein TNCV_4416991 [Trichonephila clavipes]|uniref:Uncharacterized protein n=1 Tax=Trichonephila clavipes TaxID=2585209 RepID=A0A8X6S1D4_TRICX|nr:hypothetical protein TNCV_4416991 [Trichonephila clavipes]
MEYRLSEYSPTERKVDDREGQCNVWYNVSYTRASGDGPRNFEPWSSDVDDTPLLTAPQHQREDVSALDRFNVHRCPTRRVLSGTGLELVTCLRDGLEQACPIGVSVYIISDIWTTDG